MGEPADGKKVFQSRNGRWDSHWSPEMLHALITVIDNEKPSQQSDLPELARKIESAFAELPLERRNEIELERIRAKILHIPILARLSSAAFLRDGIQKVDFAKLPDGVLSPKAYAQWKKQRQKVEAQEKEERRNAKQLAKSKGFGNRATQGLQAKYDEYKITSAHATGPAARQFTLKLKDLQGNIAQAVEHRLLGAGRMADDIVGGLQLPSTDRWNELWELLTGGSMPDLEPGMSRLHAMRQTVPLTLGVLGRAIVGAAVARWTLLESPLPQVDAVTAYELQALRELNLRADRTGGAYINNEARRAALENCVMPKIEDKATALAKEVDALLLPFMMPNLETSHAHERIQTIFQPEAAASARVNGTVNEPGWAQTWQSELANIFRAALMLRVQIEQEQGTCGVNVVKPGDIVVPAAGAHLGHEDIVLISMFPRVWAQFPSGPGGDLQEAKLISEGEVYIFERTGGYLPLVAGDPSLRRSAIQTTEAEQVVPNTSSGSEGDEAMSSESTGDSIVEAD